MKVELKKVDNVDCIVLTAPVNKTAVVSKSGKSQIVASSNGNVQTACQHNGSNVTVGFNAYIPAS